MLLADEPLGALDKKLREEMQLELRQLQRNVGITFVFVTHDQEEALTLSDRIAVMSTGRVLQIAPSEELYENPNCREVAEFIGNMNLFPGAVARMEKGSITVEAGRAGTLRAMTDLSVAIGQPVFLAVRPEKLSLTSGKPPASAMHSRVASSRYLLGDRAAISCRSRGRRKAACRLAAETPERTGRSWLGGEAWLSWKPELGRLLAS